MWSTNCWNHESVPFCIYALPYSCWVQTTLKCPVTVMMDSAWKCLSQVVVEFSGATCKRRIIIALVTLRKYCIFNCFTLQCSGQLANICVQKRLLLIKVGLTNSQPRARSFDWNKEYLLLSFYCRNPKRTAQWRNPGLLVLWLLLNLYVSRVSWEGVAWQNSSACLYLW